MSISYTNTNPAQNDTQVQLLGKMLQLIGGQAEPNDSPSDLLKRIVTAFNGAAVSDPNDFVTVIGDTMTGPLQLASGDSQLRLGGTTSSFPAIGNSGANLRLRLADDSNYAVVQTGFLQANVVDASTNTSPVAFEIYHETSGGNGAVNDGVSMDFRADSSTTDRQLQARVATLWTDATHASMTSHMRFTLVTGAVSTEAMRLSNSTMDLLNGTTLSVAGNRVVNARKTGWTVPSGTASRATFDTATVTTEQLAQRLKALIEDLHQTAGHGLIGT